MKTNALLILSLATVAPTFGAAPDYPVKPVPATALRVEDGFWFGRFETNRLRTVWYDFQKCEETGRIDNFAKAAKQMSGPFEGIAFNDSDVFKVVEGAAYILALHPDPKLQAYTEKLIDTIAAAQEPDGYLYTIRTIHPDKTPGRAGNVRWLNERGGRSTEATQAWEDRQGDSHELYNAGHMYERRWRGTRLPASASSSTWPSSMPIWWRKSGGRVLSSSRFLPDTRKSRLAWSNSIAPPVIGVPGPFQVPA